jgi:hypothetical protein
MIGWWTRNDDGFWCNVCGNCLKPSFHFESDDEADEFEPTHCSQCGAPDEIDPEAI